MKARLFLWSLTAALAGFLFVGLLGFAQIDRGFERIWEIRQHLKPGFLRSARRTPSSRAPSSWD